MHDVAVASTVLYIIIVIIIVYSPFSMLAQVGLLPPTAFGCHLYNMQPL